MQEEAKQAYLKLQLGDWLFAVAVSAVEEIATEAVIAALPSENPQVFGVMYYAGQILPVFGSEQEGSLVVVCRQQDQRIAFRVSEVLGFFTPSPEWQEEVLKGYPGFSVLERTYCDTTNG